MQFSNDTCIFRYLFFLAVPNSPISSVSDRFLSPVNSSAKKPLFTTGDVRPGQSLLNNNAQKPVAINIQSKNHFLSFIIDSLWNFCFHYYYLYELIFKYKSIS